MHTALRYVLDLVVLSSAYWLAWLFRFELEMPPLVRHDALLTWPYLVTIQFAALLLFRIPRIAWRYVSMRDVLQAGLAVGVSSAIAVAVRLLYLFPSTKTVIPLGVLAMDFSLVFLGLVGVRAIWRVHKESKDRRKRKAKVDAHNVLLIGAGEAGVMVARELERRPDLALTPVGFLDDDAQKQKARIAGLQVLGTTADLKAVARQRSVNRALITIANATGPEIRRIVELCRDAGLVTKIVPGIYELVGGKVNLSRVREVAIEDLLGREPVRLDEETVQASLRSRVVLVSGAGGSIGSELCRQICRFGPERLILLERFENALFEIHRELATDFPHVQLEPRVADVCDVPRMSQIFEHARPQIVFHAAAHKHVPMMEWNPGEAVKNNVGGTRVLATLADRYAVERFVLVSTDKAVNPTSVMGVTKRVAEIYLQALAGRSATRFVTVRFGNVLGSNGSVVPIFRKQIASGGPVLVTHPEMRRYFMTIREASQLVMQAGAMGAGGEIFVLDMGEPVKIVSLARDLIMLSGLKPDEDIEIRFTGIRPGEKLWEELSTIGEEAQKTRHPKIFIGRGQNHDWELVSRDVEHLVASAVSNDIGNLRALLAKLVPEYEGAAQRVGTVRSTTQRADDLKVTSPGSNLSN